MSMLYFAHTNADANANALQMTEFEIPKARAEKILAENGGDLQKALGALMSA
jgi:hypothetical protein